MKCGIDLGTMYSAISWYDRNNGHVMTVNLSQIAGGKSIVPSVVLFPQPDENGRPQPPVVGEVALNAEVQLPGRVIKAIKRSMGLAYKTPPIDGKEYTPQEVSAEILKALVKEAESYLAGTVTDVVITVPAYFGDNECNATREAGEKAGLNVMAILPEPHAAALAYSVEKADAVAKDPALDLADKFLLVYDLGGGTFDVTLIHAVTSSEAKNALNLQIETLYKAGNSHRGGLDWDAVMEEIVSEKLVEQLEKELKQSASEEPQDPPNAALQDTPAERAYLNQSCEKSKCGLSYTSPVSVLACMGQRQVKVSRTEFEERTTNLLLETRMLLEEVLDKADELGKPDPADPDKKTFSRHDVQVMLTGGATKMPMVKKMIQDVTGQPPLEYGNPELLVSIGASYWAHLLTGAGIVTRTTTDDGKVEEVTVHVAANDMVDTVSYAVGIEMQRKEDDNRITRYNGVIVPPNSRRGESFEKEVYKSTDKMKEIRIILYRSDTDTEDLTQCMPLATFVIPDLPDGGKAGDPVRVKLGHDKDGILQGEAEDLNSKKKIPILVERGGLTE